jgi:6-phosphofructokinase 1
MAMTLGILTSGGDCAGLNAVIRAATDAAAKRGWQVLGLRNGHLGLLSTPPEVVTLTEDSVRSDLLRIGGTILGTTTKGDPFAYPEPDGSTRDRSGQVLKAIQDLGIDRLLVIGGDGSMRVFDRLLAPARIPWVGVPKTIDNDVPGTEFAVGFFTAVSVVAEALDRLSSTAASHRRIMLLEAMGRDAGFLALFGGVAGGADVILIPEFNYDLDGVVAHIKRITHDRPGPVLVVVAEGISRPDRDRRRRGNIGPEIAALLAQRTGFEARSTVLGHLQRGGSPVAFDRLLASTYGVHAVELLASGYTRRMVAWRGGVMTDIPMSEVVTGPRAVTVDSPLVRTACHLGIYLGEGITPSARCAPVPGEELAALQRLAR